MSKILVYNTLTRRKEAFEPVEPGVVRMYICGITPQDYPHIGHARTYVAYDVIRRYLEFAGYEVFYVQNITDIDDKIIAKSLETGKGWREIANYYFSVFLKSMDRLNVKRPHVQPRVTDHIEDIIRFIEGLIEKGFAYVAQGNVYFDVDKFSDYGKLSRIDREKMMSAGEQAPGKRKPYDFALWKAAKPGEPWWESPWGPGRPGWHIECSVMSSKYLGSQFDIHGGATELIFPHHENEIAQSEAYFGVKPWVKYWLHTGLLKIRGEKMSKSLGNIIPIHELLEKYDPMVVRYYLASTHYRSVIDFTFEALEQAARSYARIETAAGELANLLRKLDLTYRPREEDLKVYREIVEVRRRFVEAMNDDFNTSKAFAELHRLVSIIKGRVLANPTYMTAVKAFDVLREINEVLGLLDHVFTQAEPEALPSTQLVELLLEVRQIHRDRREYEVADYIARKLRKMGFVLEDYRDRTIWHYRPRKS